ncbi:MAG TPA: hypothetical protein V6C97_14855 [Oculatellaceae cyanobacterium]
MNKPTALVQSNVAANAAESDSLSRAVTHFRKTIATEQRLTARAESAMQHALMAAQSLIGAIGDPQLLQTELTDGTLTVSGNGRTLTLAPAQGCAMDTRLSKPRAMLCSQILVYAHLDGQDASTLIGAFRVYEDGLCTDGHLSWHLDDGDLCMLPFMTSLVAESLLEYELFWPALDQFPEQLRLIPIDGGKPAKRELSKPCIGFECAIDGKTAAI